YVGCTVNNDYHSWSARRKGFACGIYQIDIPVHDDEGQLFVNGIKVWEHIECCDSHVNVWTGALNDSSTVVYRVTEGFGGSLASIQFTQFPVTNPSGYLYLCLGNTLEIAGLPANSYAWSTGATSQAISINPTTVGITTYTLTANLGICSVTATDTLDVGSAAGDPSVYGDNVWNVYAYNAGDYYNNGHSWNEAYSGYYVDSALNFNSESKWAKSGSPSAAQGYSGCHVNGDYMSWSAERRGFPCGYYQINVPNNDDAAELLVNGSLVWSYYGCCNYHSNVWSGLLNDTSRIAFRVTEGQGDSYGLIEFVPLDHVISVDGPTTICPGFAVDLNGVSGGTYLWSTGETTRTISVATTGNYHLSIEAHGCSINDSVEIHVAALDTPVITLGQINVCPPVHIQFQVPNFNSSLNYNWNITASAYFYHGYGTLYAAGNFTLTATDELGCSAASHISIQGPPGAEMDYGNEVWKVSGYAYGSFSDYGNSWRPWDYEGYYIDNTLNFDSQNLWDKASNPSTAFNYQGCSMNDDFMSWSARRKGFSCGIYQIDVLNHDDQGQLFVDGIKVWDNVYATDSPYVNAWTGPLNSSSIVEFRVTDGYGDCFGALHFTLVGGSNSFISVSGNQFVCTGQSYLLTSTVTGASYLWSNGGTTNPTYASQSGSYSVTVTDDHGCALTSAPANITILSDAAPVAHITASGNTICDWNTVTLTSNSYTYGYLWNTGATTQSINTDRPGDFILTITNASGCSDQDSVNIGMGFTPPAPPVTENNGPIYNGQSANLKVSGLAPGGEAASFNGGVQYIEVNQQFPQTNFTIEMWVKTTDPRTGIFSRAVSSYYNIYYDLRLYLYNGQLHFSIYNDGNTGFIINDGKWHHIAAVVQSGVGVIVYVDGSSSGIIDYYDNLGYTANTFYIGDIGYSYPKFNGQIDNVRIWDEAKSQTDIRNNMMLEMPVSSDHLIYHSPLNGNLNVNAGTKGHSPYGISYVTPDFYTYTWTGTGAPSASTNETQTTAALSSTETFEVTASTGCSPSAAASTTVIVNSFYYTDADGDGYGSSTATPIITSIDPGPGYANNNSDCDDSNPNIHPGATEICANGIDENCNGQTDENCITYYADNDGDSCGNPAATTSSASSTPPAGYVSNSTDCNDANAAVHPGAVDACNNIDDNCNGVIDENALTATLTPSGNVNVCKGASLTLTANSVNGIEYIWFKNGKLIYGASGNSYTVNKNGSYSVRESNLICSSISATTSVATIAQPSATITYTGSLDLCGNGSVMLTANSGSGFSYQWKKGTANISGATNQNYTATSKSTYKVVVTNSSGCSKTSAGVKVTNSCKSDLSDEQTIDVALNIYPNPAHDQFVIEMDLGSEEEAHADIQIFNSLGQQVYSQRAEVSGGRLREEVNSLSDLSAGNYFVRVIVGEKIFTEKVMIQ
ncbi:MAG TPA: MopE-related protein, partial [Chitinophagales bacterium]|nr:MopE-related protein [Chitinophagales bacterium]